MSDDLFGGIPRSWFDSFGPKRKTDEPEPVKPDWLIEREYLEDAIAEVQTAFESKDYDRAGYEHDLESLAEVGITAEIVIHGALPELTHEQQQEKAEYEAAYAAWEERNPIIDEGWMNRIAKGPTPFLNKIVMGDYTAPPGTITWGWSNLNYGPDEE